MELKERCKVKKIALLSLVLFSCQGEITSQLSQSVDDGIYDYEIVLTGNSDLYLSMSSFVNMGESDQQDDYVVNQYVNSGITRSLTGRSLDGGITLDSGTGDLSIVVKKDGVEIYSATLDVITRNLTFPTL